MNDDASIFYVLTPLWQHRIISTRLHRALWSASHQEGIFVPGTVGTMRQALLEQGMPKILSIPGIGHGYAQQLYAIFVENKYPIKDDALDTHHLKILLS